MIPAENERVKLGELTPGRVLKAACRRLIDILCRKETIFFPYGLYALRSHKFSMIKAAAVYFIKQIPLLNLC